jgi:Tol biopolymer transport system component
LYRKQLDTSAAETLVLASATRKDPTDWSADGTSILFTEIDGGRPDEIWLHDLGRGSPPRAVVQEHAGAGNARFSPDGRYIAFASMATGRSEVYVQALAADASRWRVSLDGGGEPAWRADGRELYFVSRDRAVTAVDVTRLGHELRFGTPHVLFEVPVLAWLRNGMSVSPDGQRFLLSVELEEPRPTQVILNWSGGPARGR